jgi:transcriptional regulator with XRE-family HTH domain
LGLTDVEVAQRIGMSVSSYRDVEARDEETFTVVSLGSLARLGQELKLSPSTLLFGGREPQEGERNVTLDEVSRRLRDRLAASDLSVHDFGERIGWDVDKVLSDPEALWDFNLVGLRDVCRAVGIDWLAVLAVNTPGPERRLTKWRGAVGRHRVFTAQRSAAAFLLRSTHL